MTSKIMPHDEKNMGKSPGTLALLNSEWEA